MGLTAVLRLPRKLAAFDTWSALAVHVAMDNTVVMEEISKCLQGRPVSAAAPPGAPHVPSWRLLHTTGAGVVAQASGGHWCPHRQGRGAVPLHTVWGGQGPPPPTPSSFWRVPEALTASGRCTAGLLWPAACSEWVSNPCFVLRDAPKLTELVSYIIKLLLSSTFSQRRLQSCLPSASIDVPPRGGCPGSCFA